MKGVGEDRQGAAEQSAGRLDQREEQTHRESQPQPPLAGHVGSQDWTWETLRRGDEERQVDVDSNDYELQGGLGEGVFWKSPLPLFVCSKCESSTR